MGTADQMDNQTHFALLNWGAYIRRSWKDGPRKYPRSASWQAQVTDRRLPEVIEYPEPVDDLDAMTTQAAMVRCMVSGEMETAMLLTKHYRDGWAISGLKKHRGKFWRFL